MKDCSYLDKKYFIDHTVYNFPFCNRKHVPYNLKDHFDFNWTDKKKCFGIVISCSFCKNVSMHLSFQETTEKLPYSSTREMKTNIDFDSIIFYSVPTSFFVLDDRIPAVIRELITEAEGCLKMNFLTGASACMRKAIYELLIVEKAEGDDYESRIKYLKKKYPDSDPSLFDILAHIQDMTSDKIHEQSWNKWDSKHLKLIIETLKTVLHDIYVLPKVKAERSNYIQQLRTGLLKDKKENVS